MKSKKLAIAAATTLMLAGMGAAQAQAVSSPTESTTAQETGLVTELSTALAALLNPITTTVTAGSGVDAVTTVTRALPDITAIGGAVNLSTINGSIDISGTNVSIKGVQGEVSAKAEAIGETTANSTAFAINGSNFSTTVIGAMNSSTLDVMGKTTDLASTVGAKLGVTTLASDGTLAMNLPAITPATALGVTGNLTSGFGTAAILSNTAATSMSVSGLSSELNSTGSAMVEELQDMSVFNMALNVAPIVAGVKIAAAVDANAWFLNPQTGIVDVSNMQLATTAIGAMNSSITHLGKNLTTLAK